MKFKIGDNVIVRAGKDRGKKGKITQVFPAIDKVIVEGINKFKKNVRAKREGEKGRIVEYSAPIHASNVMLEDGKTKQPSRIGYAFDGTSKQRVSKKSGQVIG